jgi:hypothetical protein
VVSRAPALALVAGCSFAPPAAEQQHPPGDDARPADAPEIRDAAIDGPPGLLCLGENNFRICLPPPQQPFAVVGPTNTGIDTDVLPNPCTFVDAGVGGPTLCVVAATTITIDDNILFVSGSHPLVLFASQTIEITNGVDVGSHFTGQAFGAGADSGSCNAGSAGGSNAGGGGGGAGGSFASPGGNGGRGGGGTAGNSGALSNTTDFLRGGCPGTTGGNGNSGAGGGGNHGGGAVLLLAGQSITIGGFVNASGGGGGPGLAGKAGGGGGGSGGMIAMAAPAITVTGVLIANGGGGGGGATGGQNGHPGKDANVASPLSATGGGTGGGGQTTDGAAGAGGATPAGNAPNAGDGAGAGGGGLGIIRILSGQSVGGTNSPAPQLN